MLQFKNSHVVHMGSALKFIWLIEGLADIYPRLGKTMEWDTAAGHALMNACNRGVYQLSMEEELEYNGIDLANPGFIAF
jgi:3'(2'), 5'-bisphosphate nucleotidase